MSSEMSVVTNAAVNPVTENMTQVMNNSRSDRPAHQAARIEFVTENGFSIERRSDLVQATRDSVSECSFLVRHSHDEEIEVIVAFDDRVIAQVQGQRHRRLSATSLFWQTLAEQQLAIYIWEKNQVPANRRLLITELSGSDLALAASWID